MTYKFIDHLSVIPGKLARVSATWNSEIKRSDTGFRWYD